MPPTIQAIAVLIEYIEINQHPHFIITNEFLTLLEYKFAQLAAIILFK